MKQQHLQLGVGYFKKLKKENWISTVVLTCKWLFALVLMFLPALQSELPGFYDPCPGEEKQLSITYEFRRRLHMCTMQDKKKLLIPSQGIEMFAREM